MIIPHDEFENVLHHFRPQIFTDANITLKLPQKSSFFGNNSLKNGFNELKRVTDSALEIAVFAIAGKPGKDKNLPSTLFQQITVDVFFE